MEKMLMLCGPKENSARRKMLQWAMRNSIPEVLVRSVMSLYEGAKRRVRLDSELLEELRLKWSCTKDER